MRHVHDRKRELLWKDASSAVLVWSAGIWELRGAHLCSLNCFVKPLSESAADRRVELDFMQQFESCLIVVANDFHL